MTMNRSTETRLQKLEDATLDQISSIIVACDQAEAKKKLKLYKGDQPPLVILTGVPRYNYKDTNNFGPRADTARATRR